MRKLTYALLGLALGLAAFGCKGNDDPMVQDGAAKPAASTPAPGAKNGAGGMEAPGAATAPPGVQTGTP